MPNIPGFLRSIMPAPREGRARFTPGAFLLRILNALLRLFVSPESDGDTGKAPPTTGSTAPILENRPDFVPLTVPYLCAAAPYDYHELGFWDFPERAGWMLDARGYRSFTNELAWDLRQLDRQYICRQRTIPEKISSQRPFDSLKLKCYRIDGGHASLSEQVAFLQAWLFFGVLAEISSICGLSLDIEAEFFATNDAEDGAKVISTAALNGLSRRWLEAAEVQDQDKAQASQPSRAARMIQVVRHAMSMQTRYVRPTKRESQSLLSYPQCMVLLSIRIVFRAVLLTLAMSGECEIAEIRSLMDPQVQQSFPAVWDELKDFSKDILLGNGWCRSECKLLERMDGAYETFAIGLTRRKMDHSGCNDFRCFADQVNEDVYKTVHVDAGCQCTSVVVDPEDLQEVLGRGKIPRIIISKDCTQTTVSENHPYNAISHVWSHGLGNPFENSLPLCQLRRLRNYTATLEAVGETPPALWIDTLCIPVAKHLREYRNKAIMLLGETYNHAEAVLVLDRELEYIDTRRTSMLEHDLLMSFVGWTRRLWTLQEAALARKLYVQTLYGPHRLENTENQSLGEREMAISQICFREDIQTLIKDRIPPLATLQEEPNIENSEGDLALDAGFPSFPVTSTRTAYQRLCFAVKHRSTSKMTDEAIILATIMGLDVKDLVQVPDVDNRMAILLTKLHHIPSDIIFANVERIEHAPFRWAPRSLLNFEIFMLNSFGPPGICTSEGFDATYEGLILDRGAGLKPDDTKYHVTDRVTKINYTLVLRGDAPAFALPDRPALLFRYRCINNDVAVVNIRHQRPLQDEESSDNNDKGDEDNGARDPSNHQNHSYQVELAGHLVLVCSGGTWDREPQTVLEGVKTGMEQRWRIT